MKDFGEITDYRGEGNRYLEWDSLYIIILVCKGNCHHGKLWEGEEGNEPRPWALSKLEQTSWRDKAYINEVITYTAEE